MRVPLSEAKILCSHLVRVCWQGQDSYTGHAESTANLEAIWPSGACLLLETPIPPNTPLRIHCGGIRLDGTVRDCQPDHVGYFLRIEFVAGRGWARDRFLPQHSCDLAEFLRDDGRAKDSRRTSAEQCAEESWQASARFTWSGEETKWTNHVTWLR